MKNGTKEAGSSAQGVSLTNPFAAVQERQSRVGRYEATLERGLELRELPYIAAGMASRQRQHLKGRMTVWERIRFLADDDPHVFIKIGAPT